MANPTFQTIMQQRLARRQFLRGVASASVATWAMLHVPGAVADPADITPGVFANFSPLAPGKNGKLQLAEGAKFKILMRWGDKVVPNAPAFRPKLLSPQAQEKQFGFNCDFTTFMPLPRGSNSSTHGLLCVNHEYTDPAMMFPGYDPEQHTREQSEAEMAAIGHSVVEIMQIDGTWYVLENSIYNRRISARSTSIRISGPAAGHARMRTSKSPKGKMVRGTLGNCGGGVTPWGTVLSCEENFDAYFGGAFANTREAENHRRYGIEEKPETQWYKHNTRFNVSLQPREPNRFGWVVEIDPYNPKAMPVKRTALGRFKHETATCVINGDGRLVVYSGDDEMFQFLYRFVTKDKVNKDDPVANKDLLDHGVLSVARFEGDGTLVWVPLVHGQGKLTAAQGFHSQADVVIEARRAAELMEATPMDRPEGIAVSPKDGRVYVAMTNNRERTEANINAANPRAENLHGHIIELLPPTGVNGARHGAEIFQWNIFLRGEKPESKAEAPKRLSCPDNLVFDPAGNLWIATDGQPKTSGVADSLYMAETSGFRRGIPRRFFNAPEGAEVTGPSFTPDGTTLFLSIQHPGNGSSLATSTKRWPGGDAATMPPRASVIAITKPD